MTKRGREQRDAALAQQGTPQMTMPPGAPIEAATLVRVSTTQVHTGPLPPPEVLAGYATVRPDFPERIFVMAEQQAAHRQAVELRLVDSQVGNARLGLWLGFVVAIIGLAAACYMAGLGHATAATIIAALDIVGLAGLFITGRRQQQSANSPIAKQQPP